MIKLPPDWKDGKVAGILLAFLAWGTSVALLTSAVAYGIRRH
ncbi:hypothetical protein [Streptomyces sp. NPDC059009]